MSLTAGPLVSAVQIACSGAVHGARDAGGRGGIHRTFRIIAFDPAVLVILGQDGGIAGAEPGRLGELLAARGHG